MCLNNQTNYSPTLTFNTLSPSDNCLDIYEFNNTFSTAKEISINTAITALIDNQHDNGYFIIKNTELKRDIKINLTNLPADYDVRIYDVNRQVIGSSTKSGTSDEKIIIKVVEGSQYNLPEANQTIGYLEISGKKVNRDIIKNTEILQSCLAP